MQMGHAGQVLEHYGHEAVFHFKAKEQGAYKFTMNNPGWVKSKQCTFTVRAARARRRGIARQSAAGALEGAASWNLITRLRRIDPGSSPSSC